MKLLNDQPNQLFQFALLMSDFPHFFNFRNHILILKEATVTNNIDNRYYEKHKAKNLQK